MSKFREILNDKSYELLELKECEISEAVIELKKVVDEKRRIALVLSELSMTILFQSQKWH